MNQELLDENIFSSTNQLFSQTTGRVFGDVGFGMGLGMIMLSMTYTPFSFFLLLPAAYVIFSKQGVKIDTGRGRIMEFKRHFGIIETGKWKQNNLYHEIAIMVGTDSVAANYGIARAGTFSSSKIYVAILDKYHYKRLEIYATQNMPDARKVAALISEKTGFPVVDFNPARLHQKVK